MNRFLISLLIAMSLLGGFYTTPCFSEEKISRDEYIAFLKELQPRFYNMVSIGYANMTFVADSSSMWEALFR